MTMPACSTCGLPVEWVRSCYESLWHLFADSPATATRGRYYFSEPDVEFYSGFHNLGSRDWHDRNWRHAVVLGEDLDAQHAWNRGDPPPLLPFAKLLGDQACIEQGAQIADALAPLEIQNGFAANCFPPCRQRDEVLQAATGYDVCTLQRFYAMVLDRMYAADVDGIRGLFAQLVGPWPKVVFREAVGHFPAVVVVKSDTLTILCINGTTTFQQFALQGLTSIKRPTNFGAFGTVPLWFYASKYVHLITIAEEIDPETPVFIVGHSYGGAVAHCLAARYRRGNPERVIKWLTYGAPKPGDQRLRDILETTEGVNLINDDDLVTVFAPALDELLPVIIALLAPQLIVWSDWVRPPVQTMIDTNGNFYPNTYPIDDFTTLSAVATRVLMSVPLDPIAGHPITEYLRRLALRCPIDSWPIDNICIDPCECKPCIQGADNNVPCAMPAYVVWFEGMTNDLCTGCPSMVEPFILTRSPVFPFEFFCLWEEAKDVIQCPVTDPHPLSTIVVLQRFIGQYNLDILRGDYPGERMDWFLLARYNLAGNAWEGDTPLTLPLISDPFFQPACRNVPTSITVYPYCNDLRIISRDAGICIGTVEWVIIGVGFDLVVANNVVLFNLGAQGHATAVTLTRLSGVFDVQPSAFGALTATVHNFRGTAGPVQVLTVLDCPPGALWFDTFEDDVNPPITDHAPLMPPAGQYVENAGVMSIVDGKVMATALVGGQATCFFDPGQAGPLTCTVKIMFDASGGTTHFHLWPLVSPGTGGNNPCWVQFVSGTTWSVQCHDTGGGHDTHDVTLLPNTEYTMTIVVTATHVSLTVNGVSSTRPIFGVPLGTGFLWGFDATLPETGSFRPNLEVE